MGITLEGPPATSCADYEGSTAEDRPLIDSNCNRVIDAEDKAVLPHGEEVSLDQYQLWLKSNHLLPQNSTLIGMPIAESRDYVSRMYEVLRELDVERCFVRDSQTQLDFGDHLQLAMELGVRIGLFESDEGLREVVRGLLSDMALRSVGYLKGRSDRDYFLCFPEQLFRLRRMIDVSSEMGLFFSEVVPDWDAVFTSMSSAVRNELRVRAGVPDESFEHVLDVGFQLAHLMGQPADEMRRSLEEDRKLAYREAVRANYDEAQSHPEDSADCRAKARDFFRRSLSEGLPLDRPRMVEWAFEGMMDFAAKLGLTGLSTEATQMPPRTTKGGPAGMAENSGATPSLDQKAIAPVPEPPSSPYTPEDRTVLGEMLRGYLLALRSYPEFAKRGTNLIYGPVVDVAPDFDGSFMARAKRVHTGDPVVAALLARVTIDATLKAAPHTAVVAKHAPGIGALPENPEWTGRVVADRRDLAEIERGFWAFSSPLLSLPGQLAVMVSGASYPAIDESGVPALFSPKVVRWVRDRVPEGTVLVTDDIQSDTLKNFIHDQNQRDRLENVVSAVLETTKAGTDLMLVYSFDRDWLKTYLPVLEKFTREGVISEEDLRASVRRILGLKKRIFQDHPRLQDIEATVAGMTISELWSQKIVLPVLNLDHAYRLSDRGIGGMAFEGLRRAPEIQAALKARIQDHPDQIPPFLTNNSPQEVSSNTNHWNRERGVEINLMRRFAAEVGRRFPTGLPPDLAEQLFGDVTGPSSKIASSSLPIL